MSFLNAPLEYAIENDMKYLMPWHRLANFLGIIPFADWRSYEFGVLARVKLGLMLLLVVLLYPCSIYVKYALDFYKALTPAIAIMDILSSGLFCCSTVVYFIELGFLKRKHFQAFLLKLDQVDAILRKTQFQNETRFQFYFNAVLLHVFSFTALILIMFHVWFRFSLYVALSFVTKEIEIYYANVLMVLIYNYSVCIGFRFKKVNLELKKMSFGYALGVSLKVKRLAKIYVKLLEIMRLFNLVFEWQLLALAMRLVVDTLFLISTAVFLVSVYSIQWALIPFIILSLKTLLSWIFVIYLATSCTKLTEEVRKTITISYKLMKDLRMIKRNPQIGLIHDELFLLMQKISSTSPHITAAGFFPVDFKMLLTCMSCVASYLIVLIQFNKSGKGD